MKLASMNIQNLFHRDLSFLKMDRTHNLQNRTLEFQELLDLPVKDGPTLERLRELSHLLGFSPGDARPFMTLRRMGGQLYLRPVGGERQAKATERMGWNGWLELRSYPLGEGSRRPKVDCIARVAPDILLLQEVEDRSSLAEFNSECLGPKLGSAFDQWLFVEGNDPRGLGHGILCRNGYSITDLRTHAHERNGSEEDLFEVDCPEYTVVTPSGEEVIVISARFKEDGQREFRRERSGQARMLRSYWERLQAQGKEKVMICGMLGEVAYGKSLAPLMGGRDLKDIAQHPYFDRAGEGKASGGTLATSSAEWTAKHDYLLLCGELFGKIGQCGLVRPLQKGGVGNKGTFSDRVSNPVPPLLWVDIENL